MPQQLYDLTIYRYTDSAAEHNHKLVASYERCEVVYDAETEPAAYAFSGGKRLARLQVFDDQPVVLGTDKITIEGQLEHSSTDYGFWVLTQCHGRPTL